MPNMELNLVVNGKKIKKNTISHYRLLDFLREDLRFNGNQGRVWSW
jgi:aerobic-type carbon monoxide dehydrogenase small subunit (CoxS/CutS family)